MSKVKKWVAALSLMQSSLMQCSTLPYVTAGKALTHQLLSISVLYLKRDANMSRSCISQVIMLCPVQFRYCLSGSCTWFCCECKFTLPKASLASTLTLTHIILYLFYTAIFLLSPVTRTQLLCADPSFTESLFCFCLVYHLHFENVDW